MVVEIGVLSTRNYMYFDTYNLLNIRRVGKQKKKLNLVMKELH